MMFTSSGARHRKKPFKHFTIRPIRPKAFFNKTFLHYVDKNFEWH